MESKSVLSLNDKTYLIINPKHFYRFLYVTLYGSGGDCMITCVIELVENATSHEKKT